MTSFSPATLLMLPGNQRLQEVSLPVQNVNPSNCFYSRAVEVSSERPFGFFIF